MKFVLAIALLIPTWKAKQIGPVIVEVAQSHKIEPLLVAAVIHVESRFSRNTCFRGAHGLMQIQTKNKSCDKQAVLRAKFFNLYRDRENIAAGVKLMALWKGWCRRARHKGHHWLLHYNQGYGICPDGTKKCSKRRRTPITTGKVGGYADRVLDVYHQLKVRYERIPTS